MAETFPKLRSDLEIRAESLEQNSPVVVKDPIARRFYRFTPIQASALRILDGTRTLRSIAESVSREHRSEVLEAQLESFVERLRALSLLDHPSSWSHLEKLDTSRNRFFENILSIKIRAFNPDALLERLVERLRFCFTAAFFWLVISTMFIAGVISILNWDSLFVSLGSLLHLYSIPLVIVVAFAVLTIHEFSHGVTLKHYGGKVEEMGFLLLYFVPAFYCNVSDAWMLKKRERVWVTLSGGFIQLFLWALATIAWRLLAPETFLNQVCLVTIAFSGVQTIFNFNPLIRLDGYYLLSDYLEIPNLRAKAFGYLKQRIIRWLLGASPESYGKNLSGREKKIFWRYGSASFLFTAGLVWIMFSRLGGWLIQEYQMWGVLLTSAMGLMSVQIVVNSGGVASTLRFLGAVADRARKASRVWIVAALLVVGSLLPWELKIAGDFTVRSSERMSVTSQIEGTLKGINVDEGTKVNPGDVLADIENFDLKNTYEETKGELATKSAFLKLLKAGSRPEEIERARKQIETKRTELASISRIEKEKALLQETVAKKEAEVQNANEVYSRSKTLLEQGLISRNEFERDRTNSAVRERELSEAHSLLGVLAEKTERSVQVKKKELEEADSALSILLAGSRKEAIEGSEAEVQKLQEKFRILEQQLDHLRIKSTISGVVTTPHLKNRLGEYIKKGDNFCEIVNLDMMVLEMPVPEKEIADVQVGYPITLKVRGYPNLAFQGKVTSISPVAVENGAERKVLVQSQINNDNGLLKAGMTGVGKILCGKRMIAHLLTRRTIRWLRTEFWEYLP